MGLEPELVIAIDPLVSTAPLIESLSALSQTFLNLPVSFSTEGLGGSLRRLRSDSAAIGICLLLPSIPDDITAYPLLRVRMQATPLTQASLGPLGSNRRASTLLETGKACLLSVVCTNLRRHSARSRCCRIRRRTL